MEQEDIDRIRRAKVVQVLRRKRVVRALKRRRRKLGVRPAPRDLMETLTDNLIGAMVPLPGGKKRSNNLPGNTPQEKAYALATILSGKKKSVSYAPLRPRKDKQIRIVIADLEKTCEECLEKRAVIYSINFDQELCLGCETQLLVDAGAVVFDELKGKKRKLTTGDK